MTDIKSILPKLTTLYSSGGKNPDHQILRYQRLDEWFLDTFGEMDRYYFSTPGRTEIGGNHTDHNHGRVLAASIDLDSIAVAAPGGDDTVILHSEGYGDAFIVDVSDQEAKAEEQGSTAGLIRGIAAGLRSRGYKAAGFKAIMTSDVLPGSGLSSSASVEVLIGSIFNALFNENKITPEELAQAGQFAENEYFGKPCGLMDQMACAVGGIITIDFANPARPEVRRVDIDFSSQDYNILVVDTGGNHADLTPDYAAVPSEMKKVAGLLGKTVCREISAAELYENIARIRKELGDRAFLRAFHFLKENQRVLDQVSALENGEFETFLTLVQDSGNSSFKWLQNVYSTKHVVDQGVSLALALTEGYIEKTGEGACRVHGGGFAGTILVFLPFVSVPGYVPLMESVFGESSVKVLNIRAEGSLCLDMF